MKEKAFKQIFDPANLKGGARHEGAKKNGWLKHWKEQKVFMFTWDYCGHCDTMMVICPCCGNNCCNAGFGDVTKDLKPVPYAWRAEKRKRVTKTCPICNLAYQFQHLAWKTKEAPKPTKKQIADYKRAVKKQGDSIFG
jgi:hypothetical protein